MPLDPIRRKMQMKKVAGFQSLERWILEAIFEDSDDLKAFGTIDCHIDG